MARNSLYPSFIKLEYQANGHTHHQNLPVVASLSGGVWAVDKVLGGTYANWHDAVDAWVALIKPFFHTTDSIIKADLYTLATPTSTPIFQASYSIGVSGTSSSADNPNSQAVWTWRCSGGGEARMMLMESIATGDGHIAFPTSQTIVDNIFEFYNGVNGFIFGRNGGVPLVPLFFSTKINDKLRKTYVLNA